MATLDRSTETETFDGWVLAADVSSDERPDASPDGDWLFYRAGSPRHLPESWDPRKPELIEQLVAAGAEAAVESWLDR